MKGMKVIYEKIVINGFNINSYLIKCCSEKQNQTENKKANYKPNRRSMLSRLIIYIKPTYLGLRE